MVCFVLCKTFVFLSFLQQNYKHWLVFAMVVNITFFPVICNGQQLGSAVNSFLTRVNLKL